MLCETYHNCSVKEPISITPSSPHYCKPKGNAADEKLLSAGCSAGFVLGQFCSSFFANDLDSGKDGTLSVMSDIKLGGLPPNSRAGSDFNYPLTKDE